MMMITGAFTIFAAVLAVLCGLAAAVLCFIFILPENKAKSPNKFVKFLHDTVSFKYFIIEKILLFIYVFLTVYTFLFGFFMLFNFSFDRYSGLHWYGGYGFLVMILGPIGIRICYELLMMFILLVKNVIQINNKLADANGGVDNDPFKAPDLDLFKKAPAPAVPVTPAAPAAPVRASPESLPPPGRL